MKHLARTLRKNMTDAERRLWKHLRNRQLDGHKFRRQKPIGPFIADFACAKQRLAEYLKRDGWRVLRFWNHEVLQEQNAVLTRILSALSAPHPDPLPRGEREKAYKR